jgi:serine-type D-Ala-D-Ala carboxypeptidase
MEWLQHISNRQAELVITQVRDSAGVVHTVTPSNLVLIKTQQTPVVSAVGLLNGELNREAPKISTVYDLASITKTVMATILLAALSRNSPMEVHKSYTLDTTVQSILAGFFEPNITLKELLTHTSGLSLTGSIYNKNESYDPDEVLKWYMRDTHYTIDTEKNTSYFDGNYILIGEVIKQLYGLSLKQVLEIFVKNYQLGTLRFTPTQDLDMVGREYAATQLLSDGTWLAGQAPHDPKARWLGGEAGHAGIFGDASSLFRFGEEWIYGSRFGIRDSMISTALAVELPREDNSRFGTVFRVGLNTHHIELPNMNGYTGPAIIIDPKGKQIAISMSQVTVPQEASDRSRHRKIAEFNRSLLP